jgi:hypothetical protein
MSREECLNDPCPADRQLDLIRMRQAKAAASEESRRDWKCILPMVASAVVLLWLVGVL